MLTSEVAQLTLAVYAGDTFSAWFGRLQATFWGCCIGIVVWYIGSGSGTGNPYGLATICFFVFTLLNGFYRNYNPGPMLTRVMTNASLMLVVGYVSSVDAAGCDLKLTGSRT